MIKFKTFIAIDRSVHYHGIYIAFLMKLAPMMPILKNYILGSSSLKTLDFIIASTIGLLPF